MSSASSGNVDGGAESAANQESDVDSESIPELEGALDLESKIDFEKKTEEDNEPETKSSNSPSDYEDIDTSDDIVFKLYDDRQEDESDSLDDDSQEDASDSQDEAVLHDPSLISMGFGNPLLQFFQVLGSFEATDAESGENQQVTKRRKVDGSLVDGKSLERLNRCDQTLKKLLEDRKNDIFCDIVLLVEGSSFSAHKGVLKAASSYFESMFTSSFCERAEKVITIGGVTAEIFELVLEYVYGREFPIDIDVIEDLYAAAEMFLMDPLVRECQRQLEEKWEHTLKTNDNPSPSYLASFMMKVHKASEKMEMDKFPNKVIADFKSLINIADIYESYVVELNSEYFTKVIANPKKWNVASEIRALSLCVKWVQHDTTERLRQVTNLLPSIKFEFLPVEQCEYFETTLMDFFTNELPDGKNSFSETLASMKEMSIQNRLKWNVLFFDQDPVSLWATIQACGKDFDSWKSTELKLDSEIEQSVQIDDKIILLNATTCYVIDTESFEVDKKNVKKLFEDFDGGKFVACNKGNQILIAAARKLKRSGEKVITVWQFDYGKPCLVVIAKFNLRHSYISSMSATTDSIYVLTLNSTIGYNGKSGNGTVCVFENEKISYHFISGYGHFQNKLHNPNKIFFHLKENERLFLIEPFTTPNKGFLHGISLLLKNYGNASHLCEQLDNMWKKEEYRDSIGVVEGYMCSNFATPEGHFIAVLQEDHVVLFFMENLKEFRIVTVLPKINEVGNLANVNFKRSSVFIRC